MRLTLRNKLMGVAAIAGLAFVLGFATSFVIEARVNRELTRIQKAHLPRLELEPRLEAEFERLNRGFQDAVAAHDNDALIATSSVRERFERELQQAGSAVDARDAAALRSAVQGYYVAADAVSRRLIADESGEELVHAMQDMQDKREQLRRTLKATTGFNRADLSQAFAVAGRAVSTGRLYQFWISAAFLIIVSGFLIAIHRNLLRGLAGLTAGFQRFGEGIFDEPISVGSHDELGELAAGANRMAESLALAHAELRKAQEKLEAKVRERTAELLRANEAIQEMNQELEQRVRERTIQLEDANRELEGFAYSVSHDLRAPLRAIVGFSSILLSEHLQSLDKKAQHCLHRVHEGAQAMGRLIDDLLQFSRTSRQALTLRNVKMTSLVRECLEDLALDQEGRQVELSVAELPNCNGDAALLKQVWINLLANALKFTRPREVARIDVESEVRNGETLYVVRDNGVGFDMQYADNLFGVFQRLHRAEEFPGTGIGLALIQRILHRHGGRIWAEAKPNEGATFYFSVEKPKTLA